MSLKTDRGIARDRLGAYFGGGSGTTWLSNVNCRGDERHLALCPATTNYTSSCGKNKEAGVTCDVDNIGEPRCISLVSFFRTRFSSHIIGILRLVMGRPFVFICHEIRCCALSSVIIK